MISKPEKINEAVFLLDFLKEPLHMHLTLPHFSPPFLSFSSPSEIPLKYSGGSSSHHIFTFIVCDIKMGNYLISEL